MDPERQPLLAPTPSEIRFRRYRPLSYEEVILSRGEGQWCRARFGLVLIFWATLAIFLSLVVSIIVQTHCPKGDIDSIPSVPPVHMSFTPLIS